MHKMLPLTGYSSILLCILLTVSAMTQVPAESLENLKSDGASRVINHWEKEEGLPNSSVQSIIQTRDGYVWLGTQDGIARFDGAQFRVFGSDNVPAIKHKNTLDFLESRDGTLWIGTMGGLVRLKNGTFSSLDTREGLVHNFVGALYEDRDGMIWIGTYGGGVQCYRDGKFLDCAPRKIAGEILVYAIEGDAAGNIWVGTNRGLLRYRAGTITQYTIREGLPHDQIWSLAGAPDGKLWIGTQNGLACFSDGKITSLKDPGSKSGMHIKTILLESDQSLLLGTDDEGLKQFSDGSFATILTRDALFDSGILSLHMDREGGLLIGTSVSGLIRMQTGRIKTFAKEDGLPHTSAQVVLERPNGEIWIGMDGSGLASYQHGRLIRHYRMEDGLPDNSVHALAEDSEGGLWVGTNRGFCRIKDGRFASYTAKEGLKSEIIRALLVDRNGTLWIGSRGAGLAQLRDGKIAYLSDRDVPSSVVRALYMDRAGNIWIGGKEGLSVYKDGKFTTYTTRDGMSNHFVFAFHEDAEGTMWLGTYGGGLIRFKHGRFTNYTAKQGLPYDYILRILEDAGGDLWMSSIRGIFRVSKSDLGAFAEGKAQSITSVLYGKEDGLRSAECAGGSQPAGWMARDGQFLFPTAKGLVSFDPLALKQDRHPLPPIHIEAVHSGLEGRDFLGEKESIEFSPGTVQIEIQYGAISLHAPKRTRFRYRIAGLDSNWIDAGLRRVAYYTNLPPGRHRFEVIACSADGVWDTTGDVVEFSIAPYFYQTRWFLALCLAGGGLTLLGLHRLRLYQLRERFAAVMDERNRIAREMHDTLMQRVIGANALLAASAQLMEKSPHQSGQYLERAQFELNKSLEEIRAEVSTLRGETVEWKTVLRDLEEMVLLLMEGTRIQFECDVPDALPPLPQPVIENLGKIIREAITNAIRHAEPQCIRLKVTQSPEWIEFHIEDDGIGFDVETLSPMGPHYGVIGMRERAAMIGGTLLLESRPDAGTTVALRLNSAMCAAGKKRRGAVVRSFSHSELK